MGILLYSPSGFALRWIYSKVRPEPTELEEISIDVAGAVIDMSTVVFAFDVFVLGKTYQTASALELFQVNQMMNQARFIFNPLTFAVAWAVVGAHVQVKSQVEQKSGVRTTGSFGIAPSKHLVGGKPWWNVFQPPTVREMFEHLAVGDDYGPI